MNECYLQEEIRSDFLVTAKRKLLWSLELELLQEFQRICAKHDLTYYAIGGTLLGAVRHKGFIPWDDDIDLVMMRSDYERFISIAKTELNEKYFLQTPDTDKGYYYGHLKLRMNGTTCIRRSEWAHKMPFHQGVFIDVFPLDAVPDRKFARKIHRFAVTTLSSIARSAPYNLKLGDIKKKNRRKFKVYHVLLAFIEPIHFAHLRDKIVQRYDKLQTKNIGEINQFYKYHHAIKKREDFEGTVDLPFEYLTIKAPQNYESILTTTYGDWKTPVKDASQHGNIFFDSKKSYTYYLEHSEAELRKQSGDEF